MGGVVAVVCPTDPLKPIIPTISLHVSYHPSHHHPNHHYSHAHMAGTHQPRSRTRGGRRGSRGCGAPRRAAPRPARRGAAPPLCSPGPRGSRTARPVVHLRAAAIARAGVTGGPPAVGAQRAAQGAASVVGLRGGGSLAAAHMPSGWADDAARLRSAFLDGVFSVS